MRVPVWNSFGGRIAALDTFQHVVPGGITFLTKIYTSHAAGVCRPLSLFLLHMHGVVTTCNMRNAEYIYFTTSATSWVCRTRQCTGMAIAALKSQLGSCLVRQIAQKKGGKKESQLAAISICLLYTSPSPRDGLLSRMPSSA